jgi:hypothetical protein
LEIPLDVAMDFDWKRWTEKQKTERDDEWRLKGGENEIL